MADIPLPKIGKFWDTERDSRYGFPSERELKTQCEREFRELAAQGIYRSHQIEAMQRAKEQGEDPTRITSVRPSLSAPKPPKPVKEKPIKPVKEKRPSVPDGYKTITELCNEWNILPFHARQALRGSGLEKPPFGWAFSTKEIPSIKKLVMKVAKR